MKCKIVSCQIPETADFARNTIIHNIVCELKQSQWNVCMVGRTLRNEMKQNNETKQ